jgi:CheY-like chemotaxis protein
VTTSGSNSTILYADDDADDFVLLQESAAMKGLGCQFCHVPDGEKAINYLEHAKADGHLPELILLDLNMPLKNGRETLEYIKADTDLSSIPVVMFSTSENPRDKEFCKNRGAATYIKKPVHFFGYHDVVDTLLSFIPKK